MYVCYFKYVLIPLYLHIMYIETKLGRRIKPKACLIYGAFTAMATMPGTEHLIE